jgi:cyclase
MLKTRLIPCIITKNDLVVQSFGFNRYLPIGNVKTAIEFFVNWDVDEIVIIDIDATRQKRPPNVELVAWAARECFVPLTVGGGIKTLDHIQSLLKAGADKVCINSIIRDNFAFISNASSAFGDQCITVSVDVAKINGTYGVYDYLSRKISNTDLLTQIKEIEQAGAGEILLNSVDRDGSREGYDIPLLKLVSSTVNIPVISLGGVGKFEHLAEAILEGGCQAVAAANIFQHMEHSTIAAKAQMLKSGLSVRLTSDIKYEDFSFDILGRPY